MASQLEVRLQRRIEEEHDLSLQAISKAKLACYLARIGEFDRAENIKIELRKNFGNGNFTKVSILLMLLDGLLLYYRDLSSGARDRIYRANLLSATFREYELISLTSAWLAHIDFNTCHFSAMTKEIRKCNEYLSYDEGDAACRISLVLGDVFLYTGQRELSQGWYEKARTVATSIGDQAAIGAITYNRAALNVQRLRVKKIKDTIVDSDVMMAQAELQTAINYQALARLKSLDHLLRSASVGLNIVKENFDLAASEASNLLALQAAPNGSGEQLTLLADLAKCQVMNGNLDDAKKILSEFLDSAVMSLDGDDRVIIYKSLCDVSKALGEMDLVDKYHQAMENSIIQHENIISHLSEIISEFVNS